MLHFEKVLRKWCKKLEIEIFQLMTHRLLVFVQAARFIIRATITSTEQRV